MSQWVGRRGLFSLLFSPAGHHAPHRPSHPPAQGGAMSQWVGGRGLFSLLFSPAGHHALHRPSHPPAQGGGVPAWVGLASSLSCSLCLLQARALLRLIEAMPDQQLGERKKRERRNGLHSFFFDQRTDAATTRRCLLAFGEGAAALGSQLLLPLPASAGEDDEELGGGALGLSIVRRIRREKKRKRKALSLLCWQHFIRGKQSGSNELHFCNPKWLFHFFIMFEWIQHCFRL